MSDSDIVLLVLSIFPKYTKQQLKPRGGRQGEYGLQTGVLPKVVWHGKRLRDELGRKMLGGPNR